MERTFDTIVLGLGAAGSAATYQLAKRGNSVLGIDQFSPPHSFGSSHGDTRIVRQAVGEGDLYTRLSLRSYEIWRDIEAETGEKLFYGVGGLFIANKKSAGAHHGVGNFFQDTISFAEKYDIRHEVLEAREIRKRFPQFNVTEDNVAYYEHNAGFLRPEACIKANLSLAATCGAEIHTNEKVESFNEENGKAVIKTNRAIYIADRAIVTVGAWLPQFLDKEYADLLSVCRQVMYWFDVKGSIDQFLPEKFPVFIWRFETAEQGMYGFPAVDGSRGGVKVATNQYKVKTTADTIDRNVSDEEIRYMYENCVKPHFPALTESCLRAIACLYTVTPDFNFIIDEHPQFPSIILVCPCAGHGFKHSATIGEILAQIIIDGKSVTDIEKFSLKRFK